MTNQFVDLSKRLPARLPELDSPQPSSERGDGPAAKSTGAAQFLDVSVEYLKKWRQRHFRPEFVQDGENGPIRHGLGSLPRFRSQHTITPQRLP